MVSPVGPRDQHQLLGLSPEQIKFNKMNISIRSEEIEQITPECHTRIVSFMRLKSMTVLCTV